MGARLHEVRRADHPLWVSDEIIQGFQETRDLPVPCGGGLSPPGQYASGGLAVRGEGEERETAPHGGVHQGDRPVRRVHGADDEEVGRQGEPVLRVHEQHAVVPVLQEKVQLAEYLGQIAPVDLIEDQEVGLVRVKSLEVV